MANLFISNSKLMKKFLLFIGYICAVALLFIALDMCVGAFFDRYLFLDNDPKLKYVVEGKGNEDIAIIGASRAAHHYIPSIIEKETGMSCYNYGMDGRNIFNHFIIENALLSRNGSKPKLILLEVAYLDIEDSPRWNTEKLSNLNVLYKKNGKVRELLDLTSPNEGMVLRLCNMYRYNSCILGLLKAHFKSTSQNNNKGYEPLYSEWKDSAPQIENEKNPQIYKLKEDYLRRFITRCLDSDTKLMVYVSPDYRTFVHASSWEDNIQKICNQYNVPFINHAKDSLFWKHPEWFNEPFHLNDTGAKVYTSLVCKEIKELMK